MECGPRPLRKDDLVRLGDYPERYRVLEVNFSSSLRYREMRRGPVIHKVLPVGTLYCIFEITSDEIDISICHDIR